MKTVTKKDLCFKLNEDVTLSDGESRKFRGVAYSGQMIKGHPFWGDLIFDISTMHFDKKVPVLFNHDPNRIVGSGTLEKGEQLFLNGEFSKTTRDGVELFDLIKNEGFPMQESVFIEPDVEELKKGFATVNGVEITAPATIFRNGKIREVSLTPLGADGNTSTQVFSLQTVNVKKFKEIKKMSKNKNFEKFSELVESEDLEGAFKFACSCQDKKEFTDDSSAKDAKIAELEAALSSAMSELKALKDTKASELKEGKVRRVKEIFKKFDAEISDEVVEAYLSTPDDKFDTVISQVESNLKKIAGNNKFKGLTEKETVKKPVENLEESEQIINLAKKAREFQATGMPVPESYEKARAELGLKE